MESYANHHSARVLCRAILAFFGIRVTLSGGENLVPEEKGRVLMVPFSSWLAPIVLMAAIPRKFFFLSGETSGNLPFVGWVSRRLGNIHFLRGKINLGMHHRIHSAIHSGRNVLLFYRPGTTSSEQNFVLDLAALIMRKTGTSMVPVILKDIDRVLAFGNLIPTVHPIQVVIGPPVRPPEKPATAAIESDRISREWISRELQVL